MSCDLTIIPTSKKQPLSKWAGAFQWAFKALHTEHIMAGQSLMHCKHALENLLRMPTDRWKRRNYPGLLNVLLRERSHLWKIAARAWRPSGSIAACKERFGRMLSAESRKLCSLTFRKTMQSCGDWETYFAAESLPEPRSCQHQLTLALFNRKAICKLLYEKRISPNDVIGLSIKIPWQVQRVCSIFMQFPLVRWGPTEASYSGKSDIRQQRSGFGLHDGNILRSGLDHIATRNVSNSISYCSSYSCSSSCLCHLFCHEDLTRISHIVQRSQTWSGALCTTG